MQLIGKVRKAVGHSKKPPVKRRLKPDLKHYSKAAGRVFASASDALKHYQEEDGTRTGLSIPCLIPNTSAKRTPRWLQRPSPLGQSMK